MRVGEDELMRMMEVKMLETESEIIKRLNMKNMCRRKMDGDGKEDNIKIFASKISEVDIEEHNNIVFEFRRIYKE